MKIQLSLSVLCLMIVLSFVSGCGQISSRVINPPKNLAVSRASGSTAILTWEASADSDIAGYRVYRGTTSETASLTKVGEPLFTKSTYTDTGLASLEGYYYAVTAIIAASQESAYTNRIYAAPYTASLPITISAVGGRQ